VEPESGGLASSWQDCFVTELGRRGWVVSLHPQGERPSGPGHDNDDGVVSVTTGDRSRRAMTVSRIGARPREVAPVS